MHLAHEVDSWPCEHRTGWKAADIDVDEFTHELTSAELGAVLDAVEQTKAMGLRCTDIQREHFGGPIVTPLAQQLVHTQRYGRAGLVFVSGIPVREHPLDDIWRIYWGLGTYFGQQVSQNLRGELQGEVRVRTDFQTTRAYSNPGRLEYHNDRTDTLSLLSIYTAQSGGENMFVSGLQVWDAVERERPELMPILKRGFYQHRSGEEYPGQEPSTPYRVPIFGEQDGLRSVMISGNAILRVQEKFFADSLQPEDVEALKFLREVIERPEMSLKSMLEPGTAVFINNHEVLHSREAFVDNPDPERRRLLLRMWIQGKPWRPKPDGMQVMRNPSGLQGIDKIPVAA